MSFFKLNIDSLTPSQIAKARRWVVFSIFVIFIAQSTLAFLLYISINDPIKFTSETREVDNKVSKVHRQIEKQLLSLLDFGQEPTQKKQTNTNLVFSFNLFVEEISISLNQAPIWIAPKEDHFYYKIGYFETFYQKIPHPPQSV